MSLPTLESGQKFSVGLSWDQNSTPLDLDLAAVIIGPTGLILDACFFNNMISCGGALVHSGDNQSGDGAGIDEEIKIDLSTIPAFAYSIVFCLMKQTEGDFSLCETARLHLSGGDKEIIAPISIASACKPNSSFAVLSLCRRLSNNGGWSFESVLKPFDAPARHFMDVYKDILTLVSIDPLMAEELASSQPVFKLNKNEKWALPIGLNNVFFGLGWDPAPGKSCDVDASCLVFDSNHKLLHSVYFGDKSYKGDVIVHSGDNLTGDGDGDDEVIVVNLAKIPSEVDSLAFTVNVYSGGNFRDIQGEYCRLVDLSGGREKELVRFDSLDSGTSTAVVLVCLYRNAAFPDQWLLHAPAISCDGRTCRDLVDIAQNIRKEFRGQLESNQVTWATSTIAPNTTASNTTRPSNGAPISDPFIRNLVQEPIKICFVGATDIPAMDSNGLSDGFCKIYHYFGHGNSKKVHTTKVHKKSLNPVWNEDVVVNINAVRKVKVEVYDKDFLVDDRIGTVFLDFDQIQLGPVVDKLPMSFDIKNKKNELCGKLNLEFTKL